MMMDEQHHLSKGLSPLTVTTSDLEFLVVPQSRGIVRTTEEKTCNIVLPKSCDDGGSPTPNQEELSEAIREYVFEFFIHRFVEFDFQYHGITATISEDPDSLGYLIKVGNRICPIEVHSDEKEFKRRALILGNIGPIEAYTRTNHDILITHMNFSFYTEKILPFLEASISGNILKDSQKPPEVLMRQMIFAFIQRQSFPQIAIDYASSTDKKSISYLTLTKLDTAAKEKAKGGKK